MICNQRTVNLKYAVVHSSLYMQTSTWHNDQLWVTQLFRSLLLRFRIELHRLTLVFWSPQSQWKSFGTYRQINQTGSPSVADIQRELNHYENSSYLEHFAEFVGLLQHICHRSCGPSKESGKRGHQVSTCTWCTCGYCQQGSGPIHPVPLLSGQHSFHFLMQSLLVDTVRDLFQNVSEVKPGKFRLLAVK